MLAVKDLMSITMANHGTSRGTILEDTLVEIIHMLFFEHELSRLFGYDYAAFIELLQTVNTFRVAGIVSALFICASTNVEFASDKWLSFYHLVSYVEPSNINDIDLAMAIMSILVVCGRFRQECPFNVANIFLSFLRDAVLRIPAVAPLMSSESMLLYITAIVSASSLLSTEKERRDSLDWDLSMRSILIRCQEIIISSSHDDMVLNKNYKMLLATTVLFVKRHSGGFSEHNLWISVVDDYITTFSLRPEDILEGDHSNLSFGKRAKIAARLAYLHFTKS